MSTVAQRFKDAVTDKVTDLSMNSLTQARRVEAAANVVLDKSAGDINQGLTDLQIADLPADIQVSMGDADIAAVKAVLFNLLMDASTPAARPVVEPA